MKITRDELLISAFKLFMSVNYEKASFAELGKMLGMSKAGIFKYYKTGFGSARKIHETNSPKQTVRLPNL